MGKMKIETGAKVITEFVGLRPKMYSYVTDDGAEKLTAKGIARHASRGMSHNQYLKQLQLPSPDYVHNRRIEARLHRIYTLEQRKRGLCGADDKRFLLEDGVNTLAFGDVRIHCEVPINRHHFLLIFIYL